MDDPGHSTFHKTEISRDLSDSACRVEEENIPSKVHPITKTVSSWIGVRIGTYAITSFIAVGTQGYVFAVVDQNTNQEYAMKLFEKRTLRGWEMSRNMVPHEVEILSSMEHPSVIQYHDYKSSQKYSFLFMEHAGRGAAINLFLRETPSEETVRRFMEPIVIALVSLHGQRIVHMDLKLDNLLLTSDTRMKLADFGHAQKRMRRGKTMNGRRGTPPYCAPEMQSLNNYDGELADAYSVGVCLHVMITQKFPVFFGDKLLVSAPSPSDDALDMLSKLLCRNPEERLCASELLSHSWFGKETGLTRV